MITDQIEIRQSAYKDIKDIAYINTVAWKEAYIGQVPQEYLDALDPTLKQTRWENSFAADTADNRKIYLAIRDKTPIGYISFGPARDPRLSGSAEIYALYLLPNEWWNGLGHELFKVATKVIENDGYKQLYILALNTNMRAINAYIKWGGRADYSLVVHDTIGGQAVTEVAVIFQLS